MSGPMTSSLTAPPDGKAFRMLCIIDEFSRESLAIRVNARVALEMIFPLLIRH